MLLNVFSGSANAPEDPVYPCGCSVTCTCYPLPVQQDAQQVGADDLGDDNYSEWFKEW